jgi:hypothetical protein
MGGILQHGRFGRIMRTARSSTLAQYAEQFTASSRLGASRGLQLAWARLTALGVGFVAAFPCKAQWIAIMDCESALPDLLNGYVSWSS